MSDFNGPCRICNKSKCWDHCKGCGADIIWDKSKSKRPLNVDGKEHECSRVWLQSKDKDEKDPRLKRKATKIKCPLRKCAAVLIQLEGGQDLADQLEAHIKAHALTISPESIEWIRASILAIRNAKTPYIDPWFSIPESILLVPQD